MRFTHALHLKSNLHFVFKSFDSSIFYVRVMAKDAFLEREFHAVPGRIFLRKREREWIDKRTFFRIDPVLELGAARAYTGSMSTISLEFEFAWFTAKSTRTYTCWWWTQTSLLLRPKGESVKVNQYFIIIVRVSKIVILLITVIFH